MQDEPALANDKQFQMRVSEEFLATIDGWRRLQPDIPPRAEAVRRLVELGIRASEAPEHQAATPLSSEPSLLAMFREFVIANATVEIPEVGLSVAKEVAALDDHDIEHALLMAIDNLPARIERAQKARAIPENGGGAGVRLKKNAPLGGR